MANVSVELSDDSRSSFSSSVGDDSQADHERGLRARVRRRRAPKRQDSFSQSKSKRALAAGINLRDLGKSNPEVGEGRMFRSSQLLSAEEMRKLGIKTIVDLRREDRPCRKAEHPGKRIARHLRKAAKAPAAVVPDAALPLAARAQPHPCALCMQRFETVYGYQATVMHADLIPSMVGLSIFRAMPNRVKAQALFAACRGKGAASVMAPAVANPAYMGYTVLYRNILDHSKRGIAKCMRVLADPANFPVLVHCIHGKDRTGIIVALVLLLCGASRERVVEDYMRSEAILKESRMHNELEGQLEDYLTRDTVIAATKDTMMDTLAYIDEKYGDVQRYLRSAGLQEAEIAAIRANLLQPGAQPASSPQQAAAHRWQQAAQALRGGRSHLMSLSLAQAWQRASVSPRSSTSGAPAAAPARPAAGAAGGLAEAAAERGVERAAAHGAGPTAEGQQVLDRTDEAPAKGREQVAAAGAPASAMAQVSQGPGALAPPDTAAGGKSSIQVGRATSVSLTQRAEE